MSDGEQYTTLLLQHKKLIWYLCRRYAKRDPDRCCDLVQEVSIALWERYVLRKPNHGALAEMRWVTRNTNTLLRNIHRRKQLEEVPLADWMADSIADNRDRERNLVQELIDALPDEDRHLLQMRLDGYEVQEIGQMMGLTPNAVYKRIARIIMKLKQINHER